MTIFQPNHFIVLPVGSWSPEYSSINERMGPETVKSIVNFIARVAPSKGDVDRQLSRARPTACGHCILRRNTTDASGEIQAAAAPMPA